MQAGVCVCVCVHIHMHTCKWGIRFTAEETFNSMLIIQ